MTSDQDKTDLPSELEAIIVELPAAQVETLLDFARFLHERYGTQPRRGSAAAILDALDKVGPLQFDEGELEAMRQLDTRLSC